MPAAVLPDLVAQAPVGEPAECDVASKKGKPRRSVAEMQLEMHNKGAFFLQFSEPGSAPNGDRIARTPAYAKGVSDFRAMEEKGFFITLDGCMFPHEQYCTPKGVSTLKGHQRSCYFFTGVAPEASTLSGKGKKRYAHLHHGC
jgi:hypothetical protein